MRFRTAKLDDVMDHSRMKIEYEGRTIDPSQMSAIIDKKEEEEVYDYAKATLFENAGITRTQLNKWKKTGVVRTKKFRRVWYFHREDVWAQLYGKAPH